MNAPQDARFSSATSDSRSQLPLGGFVASLALGLCLGACGGGGGSSSGGAPLSAPIQFSTPNVAAEGQPKQVTIALTQALTSGFTVRIRDTFEGTASVGSDYFPFDDRDFQFNTGNPAGLEVSVTLDVFDDDMIEGPSETVVLELALQGANGGLTPIGRQTILIEDDDFAEVRFTSPAVAKDEESMETFSVGVELLLEPAQTLAMPLAVVLQSTGAGNATPGVDFTIDVSTIEFQPGGPFVGDLRFTILDDTLVEGDEGFEFILFGSDGVQPYSGPPQLFVIRESDFGSQPTLLLVTESGLPVGSGAGFDFGALHAQEALAANLTLANIGVNTLGLSTLTVHGDTRDFRVEMVPASAVPLVSDSLAQASTGKVAAEADAVPRETLRFPYRSRPVQDSGIGVRLALEPLSSRAR